MITLQEAQQIISNEIKKIDFDRKPYELYEPIRYILNIGGKRIRPAMALISCSLFNDKVDDVIPAALALEVFHNFTLVHDDIMDNALLRRGQQTVHAKWNNNIGLLSGDAMCIVAYELLVKTNPKILPEVIRLFNKTALEVCEGQQFDMNFETRQSVSEGEYLRMIELKTSVLLAACLKIGAICGGASDKDADLLYSFGRNVGLAFQLQDDLLDIFGDEATLGKEVGKDVVSNKKTYLLIKALELAKGTQLENLKKWINAKNFNTEDKIAAVKIIYVALGIKEITLNKIESYFLNALDDLKKISVSNDRKFELQSFLFNIRNRKY